MPEKITLVGLYKNNEIIPYRKILLNQEGYIKKKDLFSKYNKIYSPIRYDTKVYLFVTFFGFCISFMMMIYYAFVKSNEFIVLKKQSKKPLKE